MSTRAFGGQVKIDACGAPCHPVQNTSWIRFRKALNLCEAETNRTMLMYVSSCNNASPCGEWVASGAVSADGWRTTGDIQATWGSIMNNLDANNEMAPVNHKHKGHYNDPDMVRLLCLHSASCSLSAAGLLHAAASRQRRALAHGADLSLRVRLTSALRVSRPTVGGS